MTLELSDDEALVLFECLACLGEQGALPLQDEAERYVLWRLEGKLEKALVEPFRSDYAELLEGARRRIREAFGADGSRAPPRHRP
jgi:hypothetical protein